jgi:hypothetical protein
MHIGGAPDLSGTESRPIGLPKKRRRVYARAQVGRHRRGRVIETVAKIIETYAARSLQGRLSAGYDDSSVSDITHSVGVMTFGAPHVGRREAGRQGVGPDMVAHNAVGSGQKMSDLVDLTSRLLDDGFVICSEKTGGRFTVVLRRTRPEGRRVFCGTGDNFPDALVDAAEEAAVPAA